MNIRKVTVETIIEIPIIGMFIVIFSADSVSLSILSAGVTGSGIEPANQIPDELFLFLIILLMFVFSIVLLTSVAEFVYDSYRYIGSDTH